MATGKEHASCFETLRISCCAIAEELIKQQSKTIRNVAFFFILIFINQTFLHNVLLDTFSKCQFVYCFRLFK